MLFLYMIMKQTNGITILLLEESIILPIMISTENTVILSS